MCCQAMMTSSDSLLLDSDSRGLHGFLDGDDGDGDREDVVPFNDCW